MLPSSISVLNVSNMDSWSRFSKSSTGTGTVTQIDNVNVRYNNITDGIKLKWNRRKKVKAGMTIGFGEQGEQMSSKLVGFLEGITTTPLIANGHLKGIPTWEKQDDTILQANPRECFCFWSIDGIHAWEALLCLDRCVLEGRDILQTSHKVGEKWEEVYIHVCGCANCLESWVG